MADHTRTAHYGTTDAEHPKDNLEATQFLTATDSSATLDAPLKNKLEGGDDAAIEAGGVPASGSGDVVDDFGFGLVSKIVSTDDDPTLSLFTFRYFILATGLSCFGGVLGQIYYFKPQTLTVSSLFHLLLSYFGGLFLAAVLPRNKFLNPGPFNIKEHVLITTTASTASSSALATELIAVENLFYEKNLGYVQSILLILSSQLLGYGLAGVFRNILVYPARAYYPGTLSSISLYQTLHKGRTFDSSLTRFFWIVFGCIFCWEWIPEFVAPLLVGVSFFCLAKRDSQVFVNVFGGINNNEGMGMFSLCFDWQYITNTCLIWPWTTQLNQWIGLLGCVILMPLLYYNNIWQAQSFPFMGQDLYLQVNGSYIVYNQLEILDANNVLDPVAYANYGQPWFAGTWAMQLMTNNLGITAALTHTLLWHGEEIWVAAKTIINPRRSDVDVHFEGMKKYPEVPHWWYLIVLAISFGVAIEVLVATNSGLEWWAFIIAVCLATILVVLTGFMFAVTGFQMPTQTIVQLIGGFLRPGKPVANMYFTLYGYNTTLQALGLLTDLKIGQYMKIPYQAVFWSQIYGTIIGALLNYVITVSIINNQRPVLLSQNGNLQWSGQNVQNYNSQAISWGALGKQLFGVGGPYQWVSLTFLVGLVVPIPFYLAHRFFPKVGFNLINTAIISWYIGNLTVGINTSIFANIIIGFSSQFIARKYFPTYFNKYNYLLAAGLDAGTQVAVFIMTFALFGAAGEQQTMPYYFLNPNITAGGYQDYCGTTIPA